MESQVTPRFLVGLELRLGGQNTMVSFIQKEDECCAAKRRKEIIWNSGERNFGLISKVEGRSMCMRRSWRDAVSHRAEKGTLLIQKEKLGRWLRSSERNARRTGGNAITYSWEFFTPMIALFLKNIGITSGIISWTACLTSGGYSITCLLNTQAVFSQAQFCVKLLNDSFLIEFLAWNGCPKLSYRLFPGFNSFNDYKVSYPIHNLSYKYSGVSCLLNILSGGGWGGWWAEREYSQL